MAYETVGDIIENRDKLRNDLAAVTAERDRLRARVAELEAWGCRLQRPLGW